VTKDVQKGAIFVSIGAIFTPTGVILSSTGAISAQRKAMSSQIGAREGDDVSTDPDLVPRSPAFAPAWPDFALHGKDIAMARSKIDPYPRSLGTDRAGLGTLCASASGTESAPGSSRQKEQAEADGHGRQKTRFTTLWPESGRLAGEGVEK
jgi:hypothetical protein